MRVLNRMASCPFEGHVAALNRFSPEEVAPFANEWVARAPVLGAALCESYWWLFSNPQYIDQEVLIERLHGWRKMHPVQISELVHLLHSRGSPAVLSRVADDPAMYESPGPQFE